MPSGLVAIKRPEQEAMPAAVPEVPFLHRPEGVEAGLVVFLVAVLDGVRRVMDVVGTLVVVH